MAARPTSLTILLRRREALLAQIGDQLSMRSHVEFEAALFKAHDNDTKQLDLV